jgi:hypothetical protein
MAVPYELSVCPVCGASLTQGFLQYKTFLKWRVSPPSWKSEGEYVAKSSIWAGSSIGTQAARCSGCDLILFRPDPLP